MFRTIWRFAVLTVAAVVVVAVLASTSQAAPIRPIFQTGGVRVMPNYSNLPNPNWYIAPGLTVNQYAYNLRTIGNAYSSVPPYALGYNPYPSVVNYGPVYPYYAPSYPYGYGYSAYPYGYGYNYYNPYGIYP
jgi:hypothetical protein